MAGRQFPKQMIRWGGTLLPQAVAIGICVETAGRPEKLA